MSIRNFRQWRKRTHRARRSRRQTQVLNTLELAVELDCPVTEVEQCLLDRDLPYHKDALGNLWATYRPENHPERNPDESR